MSSKPLSHAASTLSSEILEFDYVIVGAGSAGCVLANRLSADGKNAVLLLEAGPKDSNLWIHVPLGYGRLFKDKSVNWMYQTEPEPGLQGRTVFQPRGKVLGGSSSINGLLYVRGQHEDYDRWRQHGNSGWGYDDVLPYFKKAENQQRGADDFHGIGGPQPVSDLSHADPLSAAFIAAAAETGIPENPDFNGAYQEGTGFFQTTTRHGRRASTAVSYLRPAKGRSNLQVETSALAQRVVFDGRRAVAVEYRKAGTLRTARARKEILVSGGAALRQVSVEQGAHLAGDLEGIQRREHLGRQGREEPVEQVVDDAVVGEARLDAAQHLREQLVAGGDEDGEEVAQWSLGEVDVVHHEQPGRAHARGLVEVVPEVHHADRGRELVVGLAVVVSGALWAVEGDGGDAETVRLGLHLGGQLLGAGEVGDGLGGPLAILLADEQRGDGLTGAGGQLDRRVPAELAEAVKDLPLPVPELWERGGREAGIGGEVGVGACRGGHNVRLASRHGLVAVGYTVTETGTRATTGVSTLKSAWASSW